jgi:ribose/xylose/arabinose/galactoside ABC-type transport system permease subunit
MMQGRLKTILDKNRMALGAFAFFFVMMMIFIIVRPGLFLKAGIYSAVFVTLPVLIVMAVSLVFVVAAGEIDLSFPSIIGLSAWVFGLTIEAGMPTIIAFVAALVTGGLAGFLNGILVTRLKLSSLVSTLGMNFLLRGLINIGAQGHGISLTNISGTAFEQVMVGMIGHLPVQMLWGVAFTGLGWLLFNRHRFGLHIRCIGDNKDSAREMGINVDNTKIIAFIIVGVCAAIAGVWTNLINQTFYPTTGDGYMLMILAAVYVGGTPTWGGVGTIIGSFIGACTIGFIETGVIASGLTGFFTQFFYGLIIILSLTGHRFNKGRTRF